QEDLFVELDLHRLPQTIVLRVARRADRAAAPDDRDAGGCPGSEEGHLHQGTSNQCSPVEGSMTRASPPSNQAGRTITFAVPFGSMMCLWWKCPKTTTSYPSLRRAVPKRSICSTGSR